MQVNHIRQIDDVMTQEIEALPDRDPIFKTEQGELCYQAIRHLWTKVWDVFQHLVSDQPGVTEQDMARLLQSYTPGTPEDRNRKEQLVLQMIKAYELGAKSAAFILS